MTVENFVRLLTGRLAPSAPRSKRLLTDDGSNILIYMTGHGGDGFLKFQDSEEITNVELADAFEQMWQKKRYVMNFIFHLFSYHFWCYIDHKLRSFMNLAIYYIKGKTFS